MSTPADRALGMLDHLLIDEESDALLEALVRGWMTGSEPLGLAAHGDDTRRPWHVLTDPAAAELWSITHAAMYTGGVVPRRQPGETDEAYLVRARTAASSPEGMKRGARAAVIAAAQRQPSPTGVPRRVIVIDHPEDDDGYTVIVVVIDAETPDPDAVLADIEAAVEAVIRIDFRVGTGWTIGEMETEYDGQTIGDLEGDFVTIGDLEARNPIA